MAVSLDEDYFTEVDRVVGSSGNGISRPYRTSVVFLYSRHSKVPGYFHAVSTAPKPFQDMPHGVSETIEILWPELTKVGALP